MIELKITYEFEKTTSGMIGVNVLVNGVRSAYTRYDWNGVAVCTFTVLSDILNYNILFESFYFKKQLNEFIENNKEIDLFSFVDEQKELFSISYEGTVFSFEDNGDMQGIISMQEYYNIFPTKELAEKAIHMSTFDRCALLFAHAHKTYYVDMGDYYTFTSIEISNKFEKYLTNNNIKF